MAERGRSLATWPFRVVAVGHAVLLLGQVLLAGALLDAVDGTLEAHSILGGSLILLAMIQLVSAVVARWPGRMPAWILPVAALVLVAEIAQVALGHAGNIALHVPLGVAIVAAQASLCLRAVRRVRRTGSREGRDVGPAALPWAG